MFVKKVGLVAIALNVISLNSFGAEPSFNQIVSNIPVGGAYSLTSVNNIIPYLTKGTTLDFFLVGEYSSYAPYSTFSFNGQEVFSGSESLNLSKSLTLNSGINNNPFYFETNFPGFLGVGSYQNTQNYFLVAVNSQANIVVLGYEDSPGVCVGMSCSKGYGDYNDLVVAFKLSPAVSPVPEPSSAFLVLSGILMIGYRLTNRKAKISNIIK